MSVRSLSAKIQIIAGVLALVALAVLFGGLQASGGGHGSPTLWYAGLAVAWSAGVLLVAGVVRPAMKKEERGCLISGVVLLGLFAVCAARFFFLAEWVAELLYR